jgi:hypothetical protein
MKPSTTIQTLTKADIRTVYSGKLRRCCCGCSGNHSDSPAQISRVLNILKANADKVEELSNCFAVELETRQYIAYVS